MTFQNEKPILFSESSMGEFTVGVIEINRPEVLNALNPASYGLIEAKLFTWANNPQISAIIIEAKSEKAFCSGGDVKALALEIHKNNMDYVNDFFTKEYFVDFLIHKYPKPIIAFADGITMGGGLGLISGASHRIVTEKSLIAMPEVGIGLFPDVGATNFLTKCPEDFGIFMGLTGAHILAGDAIAAGLADYYMIAKMKRKIFADLLRLPWTEDPIQNRELVTKYLNAALVDKPAATNFKDYLSIRDKLDTASYFGFFDSLASAALSSEFMQNSRAKFLQASPTAKQVFFEATKRHRNYKMREVFIAEWGMALQFSKEREFYEGVRAVLIDKDRKTKWQPAIENEVKNIERFFMPNPKNLLNQKISKFAEEIAFFDS